MSAKPVRKTIPIWNAYLYVENDLNNKKLGTYKVLSLHQNIYPELMDYVTENRFRISAGMVIAIIFSFCFIIYKVGISEY